LKALAIRYASALADVALEQKQSEQIERELAAFVELLGASAELRTFLASPAVARLHKHGVIEKLVARLGASTTLQNFLFVLVDNRRTNDLAQITQAFTTELHRRLGMTEAQVTSAQPLGENEKQELTKTLEGLTGRHIVARYQEDPALIAGAVVQIGSTVYDGSVRARLDRLRARLASE
jgi:F-type H+-transporting ATPase subunit delta